MAKSDKLYSKSPKMERDDNGDMEVRKPSTDGAAPGEDGSNAEMQGEGPEAHTEERASMHKRHETELKDMHKRHQKDVEEMHGRHEGKKDKK